MGNRGIETLWQSLSGLIGNLAAAGDRDSWLDDCLDQVVAEVGADKGLIVLTDASGGSYPVQARGDGRALSDHEREEMSRTVIRQVREGGEPVLWEPELSTMSAAAFGIQAAIAAPIRAIAMGGAGAEEQAAVRGVLYLDFRTIGTTVTDHQREFVELAAGLIAIVLSLTAELRETREGLRKVLTAHPGGSPLATLDEILRPPSMEAMRREVETAIDSDQPIVITGESGTGKTLLARAIAAASGREPFVRATLGQSDDLNTIGSELFGHVAGAFSGALSKRVGLVEYADGGVLLLDEILNLPKSAQQLLLDFTQFGTYRPLGHSQPEPKHARVRLIAATNGSLEDAVEAGTFRQDLYYRLASIKLELPPLRERRPDIPGLAESHLRRRDPSRAWNLSPNTRRLLMSPSLSWPGNVRQLEAVIARACDRALARDATDVLEPRHFEARDFGIGELPDSASWPDAEASSAPTSASGDPLAALDDADPAASWKQLSALRDRLEDRERELFVALLDRCGGVVAKAARELGMSRTSLVSRLTTHKIPHGRGT